MSKPKFVATVEKIDKGWIVNIRVYKSGLGEAQRFIEEQFRSVRATEAAADTGDAA